MTISADERNLLDLAAAKSKYTIHGLPAEEFPALPQVPADTVISLPGPVLRDLVRKTLFAADTDEARVTLTGCFLTWDGQMATMAATDSHRLAVKRAPVTGQFDKPVAVIIPARALQELLRLLGSSEDPVTLHIGENQVLFAVGRVRLVTRLIEGPYPAYERFMQQETAKHMTANRQQFYDAVRRAAIVARAESNKLILRSEDSTLTITAETGEVRTRRRRSAHQPGRRSASKSPSTRPTCRKSSPCSIPKPWNWRSAARSTPASYAPRANRITCMW